MQSLTELDAIITHLSNLYYSEIDSSAFKQLILRNTAEEEIMAKSYNTSTTMVMVRGWGDTEDMWLKVNIFILAHPYLG